MKRFILIQRLGFVDYLVTWRYQKRLLEVINNFTKTKIVGSLLFAEHFNVYTLGKYGNINHILLSSDKLNDIGISFYNSDRGGDITYHGLGQLIVYSIINILYFTDLHKYLRVLEENIINILEFYQLPCKRSPGESGVWLNFDKFCTKKICSLGIRIKNWVVLHGLALNINTNLKYFNNIIPCGIIRKEVKACSMQQVVSNSFSINSIIEKFIFLYSKIFKVHIHYFK